MKTPDELKQEIKLLLEQNKHLHPPEIARRLGVPEACLLATAVGAEATRLVANPARILADIKNWGSVLCVFGNEIGSFMPLGHIDSIKLRGTTLYLRGDHLDAEIESSVITDAYLLIEKDEMHGNTRSLQFFDGEGNSVLKVYIFHKTKFRDAKSVFDALTSANQSRVFHPSPIAKGLFDPRAMSQATDADAEDLPGLHSDQALREFLTLGDRFEIECFTRFTRACWTGVVNKIRIDTRMIHFHEEDLRAHLRLEAFQQWTHTSSGRLAAQGCEGRLLRICRLNN